MRAAVLAPAAAPPEVGPNTVLARIIVAHAGEHVEERPLRPGRLIIGRTVDNDLQVESKFISRHHCQITTSAEGSVLEDLNSTNGVYVKSKRVRRHHLNDGDVVVLGKHEIMYLDERSARARAQQQPEPTGDHHIIGEGNGADDDAPAAGAA
jgi:pSer/pThr/pTyr-binding forkhead associated (FHA) protein